MDTEKDRSDRIKVYMKETFKIYNRLRCKTNDDPCKIEKPPFWDIVVLTTFDSTQKKGFEQLINAKKQQGHLPDVPVLVIADPDGQKLGVGGSTLHVLTELLKCNGSDLYSKKILVIHSGGSSQRLPSYSVLGKIFTPVPCEGLRIGSSIPEMLDLKFAMYLPLVPLLQPGVFVTCADDIETYCLDMNTLDTEMLKSADVVALGHPSEVKIGEGHGVYVFENYAGQTNFVNSVEECKEVLQKPSTALMRERGAVFEKDGSEQVWSDSVFWLSESVCRHLIKWYENNSPVSSELDAYAHFLPCMGTSMKDAMTSDFKDYRAEMIPIFKDRSLKILLLNNSKFYHLGTMEEYLEHFTCKDEFISELSLLKNSSNVKNPSTIECSSVSETKFPSKVMVLESYYANAEVAVALEDEDSLLVLEYCQIFIPCFTKGNLIVNNCVLKRCPSVTVKVDRVDLFDNILYHTVPIRVNKQLLYVTIAFDITANMKKSCRNLCEMFTLGCSMDKVIQILGYEEREVRAGKELVSLWTIKMFKGGQSPEESFWLTHNAVNLIRGHLHEVDIQTVVATGSKSESLFSMVDLVAYKDLDTFMAERLSLSSLL